MQRPLGITVIAILAAISGVLSLCVALAVFGVSLVGGIFAPPVAAVGGVVGVALGIGPILPLIFAYGAWLLKPWAWWLGIFATGISLLGSVFGLLSGVGIPAAISHGLLPLVIFVYLLIPNVRHAFHQA